MQTYKNGAFLTLRAAFITNGIKKEKKVKGKLKLNNKFNFALESIPFQYNGITVEVLLEQRCEGW